MTELLYTAEEIDALLQGSPPPPLTMVEVLWDRTQGGNIGNMTLNGGLGAPFNGASAQDTSASAKGPEGSSTAWIGKSLGVTRAISRVVLTGSSNHGFSSGLPANVAVTGTLRAKLGSGATVTLGSVTQADAAGGALQVASNDTLAGYDQVWVDLAEDSGTGNLFVARMDIYVMVPNA